MVSNAFFTGSKYLVEDNDGRQDYLRLDGERFLAALSAAGRKVHGAPFEAEDAKKAYLAALVRVNGRYFSAREYEADAKGKYLKHDERAERRFRVRTASRLSDCATDLRTLLSAHDELLAAALDLLDRVERGREQHAGGEQRTGREQQAGGKQVEREHNGTNPDRTVERVRSTLLACTDRAISEGWFPCVEAYYYSLSPGELVAEDRERRKQRIEGTEESRGIAELLDRPGFERLSRTELRRIRELGRESPGSDPRIWKRLLDDYSWYVGRAEHGEKAGKADGR